MKIMTVLGTRPEIIRLSQVIRRLDEVVEHVVVHTGQNYAAELSDVFFRELEVRAPDEMLGIREPTFGAQVGVMFTRIEPLFERHRPDRVLVLGDTNSGLVAVIARRLGIPVYHMEAGNRCYDDRVPEEVNRRIIDHSSSVLMPYTERSRANLIREGFAADRIYVTGNPINEVLQAHAAAIGRSDALRRLGLEERKFFLVTLHRAENVDKEERLRALVDGLAVLHKQFSWPVVCALHPRTQARVTTFGVDLDRSGLRFLPPLGFFDFVRLEQAAGCVLSDSGTVQEETCLFGVPNVTVRDVTERPETVECGSNILSGAQSADISRAVTVALAQGGRWTPPPEYMTANVSYTVRRIVTGYRMPDAAESDWRAQRGA